MSKNAPSRRTVLKQTAAALGGVALTQLLPGEHAWAWVLASPSPPAFPGLAIKSVVLDPGHPLANFAVEGAQPFTPTPSLLVLLDQSVADVVDFYGFDPAASPGNDVDVVAAFQVRTSTPLNADSGVRFVINDGQFKAVMAGAIIVGGIKGIGLAAGVNFWDPTNYPVFVTADWTQPTTVRFRRSASGDAEIVDVNGVAPSPRALLAGVSLPPRNRLYPTIEFGCMSPEALCDVEFSQFYSEVPASAIRGALAFTEFRIRDDDTTDRLRVRADYALGADSDGINPSSEAMSVKLSTPTYGQFYPAPAADFNPLAGFVAHGRAPRRRWSLNDAERARTGIERFDVDENPDHTGAIILRDLRTTLPNIDYSTVLVTVDIGFDLLTDTVHLVEKRAGSGRWRLVG